MVGASVCRLSYLNRHRQRFRFSERPCLTRAQSDRGVVAVTDFGYGVEFQQALDKWTPYLPPHDVWRSCTWSYSCGTTEKGARLENSVPTIGTCPYFLPSFVGRPSRDVLRPSQPSDGPALTGHCGPELLHGPQRSVVRVPTCSGSSKLANMLFQVCPAPR